MADQNDGESRNPERVGHRAWFRRYPVASFLVAIMLWLVIMPFAEQLPDGDLIEGVGISIALLAALRAVGGRGQTLAWGLAFLVPALVGKWANHIKPDLVPAEFYLVTGGLFVGFVALQLLRFIVRAPRIDSEVLCAGLATYVTLGLLWAFGYILVARLIPNAFVFSTGPSPAPTMKGFTAIYFSFITLCTVGYGDIVPASGPSRMLAMTEGMIGTLYIAVLVARLVSLYSSRSLSPAAGESGRSGN